MMLGLAFFALSLLLAFGNLYWLYSQNRRGSFAFNVVLLVALFILSFHLFSISEVYAGVFNINAFGAFFAALLLLALLLLNALAYAYSHEYSFFAGLSSFMLLGSFAVIFSAVVPLIFVGLELVVLPAIFIILLSTRRSVEAAVKYLIISAMSTAAFALAMAFMFGASGSIALSQVASTSFSLGALALFFVALGIESSQFPFSVVFPDVYEGSAAYATAMLGGFNKVVGFAALILVVSVVFFSLKLPSYIAAGFAVLTMFYGNLAALRQQNLKRLMAYSSISQAGYIIIGLAANSSFGIEAMLFQLFAHSFLFIGALAVISWLESMGRSSIDDVIGLKDENKLATFALVLFLLSLIGMPFTTGFVGKFLLFLSAVQANLVWLAILGILNSIISIFYYAKVITASLTSKLNARKQPMPISVVLVLIACITITLLFGIFASPIVSFAEAAATSL